ncbi:MAG: lytic murein transglycosylase [Hyphomicrobium sp.]
MRLRRRGRHRSVSGLLIASFFLSAFLSPATATGSAPFHQWIKDLRREALKHGIESATFDAALAGVQPIPKVVELDRRQPEFRQTFWEYLDQRITPERIANGRELLVRHRDLLNAVEKRYGVQPRFIVALWGLESNFGDSTGNFPLYSSLATLAYDARRHAFFREQLFAALELLQRGDLSATATSSWAGAIGQPQFIPTTYRDYAVDFNGDGRRDLQNALPDIFASAANYLAKAKWRGDLTWGREVLLPSGFNYALTGLDTKKSLIEWTRLGVRRADGARLPEVDVDGSIILPGGADGGPALLVYSNFNSIMTWNRSILYAVAVGHLADRLTGYGPFVATRRTGEVALSRNDIMEIQRILSRLGYETGGIDGLVGESTREAIRSFQQQASLRADGYPSATLLDRLRAMVMR